MSDRNTRRMPRQAQSARQELRVTAIDALGSCIRRFTLQSAEGRDLAPFDAGCSLPVLVEYDDKAIEHQYAISSSPRDAQNGFYQIVVNRSAGGYASTLILDNWKVGSHVIAGVPRETSMCRHAHDSEMIVAIAGGMGIVPFHSMAKALAEGGTDYHLTIFYAADRRDALLYEGEWPALERQSDGRLKVVPVLTREDAPGYERGPITRELIARHADSAQASFFICGPGPLVAAMRKELNPLGLSRARLRFSFSGDSDHDRRAGSSAVHQLTIRMEGAVHTIPAREDETILLALEKAGLQPASLCRSSICGFCRATLVSGTFILMTDEAGERRIRERFSSLHPCCSYPVSDMEIVVRREKS